jgi:hypothetical protein
MRKSYPVKIIEAMIKNYEDLKGKPRPTSEQFATAIVNTLVDIGMTPPEYDSMPGSDWACMKKEFEPEDA